MRRALRWIVRGVLGVVALVVLALAATLIAIHTDWGRNLARGYVVDVLNRSLAGGAKIERIDGSVLGTLTIRGVELGGRGGAPWVKVGTIELRVALLPLIARTVHVDSIVIDDVAIDQHVQPPFKTSNEPSAWRIELVRGEVHRGNVKVTTFEARDVELNASASVDRGVVTAMAGLRGTLDGHDIAATGTVHLDHGAVSVPSFAATVDQAHVRVLGLRLGDAIGGVAAAFVPATTVVHLPGDVAAVASVSADGAFDVRAAIADATLRVVGGVSIATETANALVTAVVPDGRMLDPRLAGHAHVTATLSGGLDRVRGMVAIDVTRPLDKQLLGKAEVTATTLLAVDATRTHAWVLLDGGLDVGNTRATATAELARDETGAITLVDSTLAASARQIGERAFDAHVAHLAVNARASGPLWPKRGLEVTGAIDGDSLRYGTWSVASVGARFDAADVKHAKLRVDIGEVRNEGQLVGSASLAARVARDSNGTIEIAGDVHTGSGTIVGNATIGSDVLGSITARNVALATLSPDLAGMLDATLAFERRVGRWQGNGQLEGRGIVVHGQPPVDLDATLQLAGRHVEVKATAAAQGAKLIVAADLDGPHDITDGHAWAKLERSAVRDVSITVDHIDLAELGGSGTISGTLGITSTGASGNLAVRGLATKQGIVDADLSLGTDARGVLAQIKARLEGIAAVTADAQLEIPARPFDPAEWRSLGKRALHHVSATLSPLDFDPSVLARAHLDLPYRGHLVAAFEITEGGGSVTATVDVTKLRGGVLVAPIEVRGEAEMTDGGTGATATISAGEHALVTLDASSRITLDSLATFATSPLSGTIAIPHVAATQIAAVLGGRDVSGGVVDGTLELGGTIEQPTGVLALTASGVAVSASASNRTPALLDSLEVDGRWDGGAGELAISARGANGGTLEVAATGRDRLDSVVATVKATKFDLAPFAALAVGAVSAVRGTLDAGLEVHLATSQVDGHLDLHDGRLPISPQLGTLKQADVHVVFASHAIDASLAAKLGQGDVKGTAKVTLVGGKPSKATANLVLHEVSIVGALQPTIDATIDAKLAHDTIWRVDVAVRHGHLTASTGGAALLPSSAPSDLQFSDQAPPTKPRRRARASPSKPWLIATIELDRTGVEIAQSRFQVRGDVRGKLEVSVGDGVGMTGTLDATTQSLEILGARAQLDHAIATWDGTPDPMLDVSARRELADLTVIATVTGRLSEPRLTLSSDRGVHTQGELIGIFLGGTPSGDRSDLGQTATAVGANVASALVTSHIHRFARFLSRVSPSYEVATAGSSEALRVGIWVSEHVFVAVRSRPNPLPIENANEAIGEWHFLSNMMLQGMIGDRGAAGLDVLHRWRW